MSSYSTSARVGGGLSTQIRASSSMTGASPAACAVTSRAARELPVPGRADWFSIAPGAGDHVVRAASSVSATSTPTSRLLSFHEYFVVHR